MIHPRSGAAVATRQVSKQVSGLLTSLGSKVFPAELRWYFLVAKEKSTCCDRSGYHGVINGESIGMMNWIIWKSYQ